MKCSAEAYVGKDGVLVCDLDAEPGHEVHYDEVDNITWKAGRP